MSTNKHALIRYRVIDKCLRQVDNAWNWKSLSEACSKEIAKVTGKETSLSERTIKGDLQHMRMDEALGYYAPIEYDRAEKSYYYSDRSYSITEAPLNRSDSNELKSAINLLRQFTGFQHLQGIDNIIQKLELLAFESTAKEKKIVHLAQPATIPGQDWLDILYDAIKEEKAISLSYQPFDKAASTIIASPYLLKEYDNRWYLYALSHEKKQIRTYGLERITEINETLQTFIPMEGFDPDSYFESIIGITVNPGRKIQDIIFEVYNNTIKYINTKPLHSSQKLIEHGENVSTYSISVRLGN